MIFFLILRASYYVLFCARFAKHIMKFKVLVIILFTALGLHQGVNAQCVINSSFLGNDTSICTGQNLSLSAPSGYMNYLWSTGSTNQNITIQNAGNYSCSATIMSTTNLVQNGDFSAGNTLFQTGHTYGTGGGWGLLSNAGQYAISTSAHLTHNNFPICGDHTTGTGNYMIVNGSSVSNLTVWCQTITVNPATNYVFSAWLTSVVSSSPAILSFTINGVSIGPNFGISSTTCSWQNYFQTWTSGAAQTTATICITNQNTASGGNDFGLDDIFFAEECTILDTLLVNTTPLPVVNIGPDTTICLGDSIVIDVTDSINSTYVWNNGSTSPIQTINSAANLAVTVTTGICSSSATKNIFVIDSPQVNFGNDTILCFGSSVLLSAQNQLSTYLWSTGSVSNTIYANTNSTYWGTATNVCGTDSDTILIDVDSVLNVDLGPDTILCAGSSYQLTSNVVGDSYVWNNGNTTNTTPVNSAYTYVLTVTNVCGAFSDSLNVAYDNTPITHLGLDSTYCFTNLQTLSTSWSRATYLWNTASVDSSINANTPGTYWVNVTNLCGYDGDTITLAYDLPIYFNLGPDTVLCVGDSFTVNAPGNNANWLWDDGSTDSIRVIHTAGNVSVSANNQCGFFRDTISVTSVSKPVITNQISDTLFCIGQSFSVGINKSTATGILWMDGNPNYQRTFVDSGSYSYSLTNVCGPVSDTFIVTVDLPVEASLGKDTTICFGEKVTKSFDYPNHEYLWSDGTIDSTNTFNQSGLYGVIITTPGLCETYTDFVIRPCESELYIPNAFTPGSNDALNNIFQVKGEGIRKFRMVIYNRWGIQVFESFSLDYSWDGNIYSKQAPSGVYSYKIWYNTGISSISVVRYGDVTLIRY